MSLGAIQYLEVADATLKGTRIDVKLVSTGYDWMRISDDGYWRPEVRAQFRTDDGAVILIQYSGLVKHTDSLMALAAAVRMTDCSSHYMRVIFSFNTGATKYLWLNTSLFVASAARVGAGQVDYEIFRVA